MATVTYKGNGKFYLQQDGKHWEITEDALLKIFKGGELYLASEAFKSKVTKHLYKPWTFRRVYRVRGWMAAIRFLLKGVE